jgi:hypothetical protein
MIPPADVRCAAESNAGEKAIEYKCANCQIMRTVAHTIRITMSPFALTEVALMDDKRPPPDRRRHGGVFIAGCSADPALSPPPALLLITAGRLRCNESDTVHSTVPPAWRRSARVVEEGA